MSTPTARDTQAFFDSKALSWPEKYGPGGALEPRRTEFAARLRELCAVPDKVLELGCGTGEIAAAVAEMGYEVTACDIARGMVEIARRNRFRVPVQWLILEPGWTALPFPDRSFSAVLAASVFEYLCDLPRVVAEVSRVLRPGGALLFSVPNLVNPIRRAEACLRFFLPEREPSSLLRPLPRICAYVSYLRLSRNRFSGEQWKAVLAPAGLRPVNESEFLEETWRRLSNASLILLAARKAAA